MKLSSKYLLSPLFIGALIVLICNDIWWKYTFSNVLTGKLSDFSGVLVLGLLFNFFSEKNRKLNALFVIVFFTFWKAPLSEGLIFAWNDLNIFPISRVVDYSDLIAFSVLPIVTHYPFKERTEFSRPILTSSIVGVTFFALTSTSRTQHLWEYEQYHKVVNFDSKLRQDILIERFSEELDLHVYKEDTVLVNGVPIPRYSFSANKPHTINHMVDSCQLTVLEKNKRKVSVNILSVKLKDNVDIAAMADFSQWIKAFEARNIEEQRITLIERDQ